ncbi:hypothetical protein D3C73_1282820 [compost metagenome]
MFWLTAAPTPARARMQREATAGDDDETAAPNWPEAGQRAMIEKVMVGGLNGCQSGMTAVASISTSHSGRAKADTTMPVDTGNTPLSQRPTTR